MLRYSCLCVYASIYPTGKVLSTKECIRTGTRPVHIRYIYELYIYAPHTTNPPPPPSLNPSVERYLSDR